MFSYIKYFHIFYEFDSRWIICVSVSCVRLHYMLRLFFFSSFVCNTNWLHEVINTWMLAYVYIRRWLNIVVCVSCACARINFVICNSIYIITRIPYSYTFRGVAGLPLWLDKTANDKLMIVREEEKSTLCRQTKKFWSIWCIHACSQVPRSRTPQLAIHFYVHITIWNELVLSQ